MIEDAQIAVLDLDTRDHTVVVQGGGQARYMPTGHLVYGMADQLWADAFDLARMEPRGDPVRVLDQVVMTTAGGTQFSVSSDGSLVYVTGEAEDINQRTLVWVDRQGNAEPTGAPPRPYVHLRLSPDGTHVALDVRDEDNDIQVWEFATQTMTRLTVSPQSLDRQPVWSPDGRRIAFSSNRTGGAINLFLQASDGTGTVEQLTDTSNPTYATSFLPDGTALLFWENVQETGPDVMVVDLEGARRSTSLVATPFVDRNAEVSSDGRWLVYQSNESGQYEIYVVPFPEVDSGGRRQLTFEGGTRPMWSPDGNEILYVTGPGRMMAVPVEIGPSFEHGNPQMLFEGPYDTGLLSRNYDVSPDGERFLMIKEGGVSDDAAAPELVLVQNWFDELKERVPLP